MKISRSALVGMLALTLVTALVTAGCQRPDPESAEREARSESVTTQTRDVESFQSIELRGAAELIVTVGKAASVSLDANERTLRHINTRVKNDTLIVDIDKSKNWFTDYGQLKITVTVPSLKSIESNGAGDIKITGLAGGDHALRLAGLHNVEAEGRVDKLNIELSGAGNVDYRRVVAGDANVTVNGAGQVDVQVTQTLHAEVNGMGAVRYSGEPQKVESELHGLGSISRH